jgi:hypothetical protein
MNLGVRGLPSELDGASTKRYVDAGSYISDRYAVVDPLNDNFSGLYLDLAGTRFAGASKWSWVNQSGATAVQQDGRLWLSLPAAGSSLIAGIVQTLPSGAWCYRAVITHRNAAGTSQSTVGLGLYESATGKVESLTTGYYSGASPRIWAQKWTNPTTFNADRLTFTATAVHMLPTIIEIEYDGTNYYFRVGYGAGGGELREFTRFAQNNFFTTKADQIGIWLHCDTGVAIQAVCPEFYRIPTSIHF